MIDLICSQRSRIWFLGSNLQWGISEYPKMQLRRDLIFGITDLLGKMTMGCSVNENDLFWLLQFTLAAWLVSFSAAVY